MYAYKPPGTSSVYYSPDHSILTTLPALLAECLVDQKEFFNSMGITEKEVDRVRQFVFKYFDNLLANKSDANAVTAFEVAGWPGKDEDVKTKQAFFTVFGACMSLVMAWYHDSLVEMGNAAGDFVPFISQSYQRIKNDKESC
jgi:hypothetical protein